MTASIAERLVELGITLPPVAAPVASYVPAVVSGGQVVTSGQLPMVDGALAATGKVGAAGRVAPADAQGYARTAALNALAAAADAAGGLERLGSVVRVGVFVASTADFTGQPAVANGASEVLGAIFHSPHARSAVGVAVLPLDAPVEVEVTFSLA